MPFSSVLRTPVLCPSCGREVGGRVGEMTFFWGRSNRHYWGLDDDMGDHRHSAERELRAASHLGRQNPW